METKLEELEKRVNDLAAQVGELMEGVESHNKALATLSNTLHVIDATSLLALYSLIQTNNLRQPDFTSNQDIIDSGCSDAINRMMKTVMLVNANEKGKDGKDESEGR